MADYRASDDEVVAFLKSEGVSELLIARVKRLARQRDLAAEALLNEMLDRWESLPEEAKERTGRLVRQRRLQATMRTP